MRRTLLPAAAALLALTSCASNEEERLREDLAAVTADDEATAEAPSSAEEAAQEEPLVPVEVRTDLLDPEGSAVGTAWMRDGENGAELELQVAGLTPGFHPVTVRAVGDCDPAGDHAAAGEVVAELPGVLVLESGVGSLTTLVGPTPLDELLAGDGTAVVVEEPGAGPDGSTSPTGSAVACGALSG